MYHYANCLLIDVLKGSLKKIISAKVKTAVNLFLIMKIRRMIYNNVVYISVIGARFLMLHVIANINEVLAIGSLIWETKFAE